MKKKESNKSAKPKVNPKLEGFDVRVDRFGEIQSSFDIEVINKFLDEEVMDKKLRNRKDLKGKHLERKGKK